MMYHRSIALLLMFVWMLGCICGCTFSAAVPSSSTNAPTTTATPSSTAEIILNSLPYMVQIDGRLFYLDVPVEGDIQIDEAQIAGYITASCYEIPDEDGECNFASVGTPYAPWSTEEYPDTYIIYVTILNKTCWRLLRPDTEN